MTSVKTFTHHLSSEGFGKVKVMHGASGYYVKLLLLFKIRIGSVAVPVSIALAAISVYLKPLSLHVIFTNCVFTD